MCFYDLARACNMLLLPSECAKYVLITLGVFGMFFSDPQGVPNIVSLPSACLIHASISLSMLVTSFHNQQRVRNMFYYPQCVNEVIVSLLHIC